MKGRTALLGLLAALMLTSLPVPARATSIPGPNGKIVFASGRGGADFNDDTARIWVADYPSGTPVQVTTQPTGAKVQHRHPNWSPDHTRIVYAAGEAFSATGTYALWIVDLRDGSQFEFAPAAEKQDRPTWSPDGTRIAYGSKGDLWVKGVEPGATPVQLTNTAGFWEERPVWSPDGETLYFNREVLPTPMTRDRDLYKISPIAPGGTVSPILAGATDDWQPAVSPDGGRLCFLRGPQNDNADLWTVNTNGTGAASFAISAKGDLNCVWSPDGSRIMYTEGAFTGGALVSRNSDKTGAVDTFTDVEKHFDGNADWATNFPPTCESKTVNIGVNQFTAVPLACTDPDHGFGKEPPTPEPVSDSYLDIVSFPAHGTLGGVDGEGRVIGNVSYTPVKDFKGTDTFTYTGTDEQSSVEAEPATVTIQVGQEGGGGDNRAPRISKIKVSAKRWRRGKKLASISLAPVGTTISFRLSEAARTTLTFQRRKRKGGKTKFIGAGKLSFAGKAGKNRVRFQGVLRKSKKLAPGTYRVVARARDAAGNRSKRNGPVFTIVPG
jgi:Tol biopolymer transport system component